MKSKYTFLQLLDQYNKIQIPIIQRSYAQGRKKEEKLRNTFLHTIIQSLNSNQKELCLDFIYGNIDNQNNFIPIDGQQRLTTLFLLYWYIIYISEDENLADEKKLIKKFSYETRDTSEEFCKSLTSNDITEIEDKNKQEKTSISKIIKNQNWYYQEWSQDPTITSMLKMLDDIQTNLKDKNIETITKNIRKGNEKIYFYYIETTKFGKSDEIYIKMNSRGRKLTHFENLKSKIEEYIGNNDIDTVIKDNFSKKIDKKWLEFLWKKVKEKTHNIKWETAVKTDEWLSKLFITIFENYYATQLKLDEKNETNENNKTIKDNISKMSDTSEEALKDLPFDYFDSLNCINKETISQFYYILEYMVNNMEEADKNKKESKLNYNQIKNKEEVIFDNILLKDKTLNQNKVQFYTICKYLYLVKYNVDEEKLSKLLYVTRNLTENIYIDNETKYVKMIQLVEQIISNSINQDMYCYLANMDINSDSMKKYDKDIINVLTEQCEKAKKIFNVENQTYNNQWEDAILEADNIQYFRGSTGFLLKFVEKRKNTDIPEIDSYRDYMLKIKAIFNIGKLKNEEESDYEEESIKKIPIDPIGKENGEFYFKRALLVFGNYMYIISRRRSFLQCSTTDKYQNWKKLFAYNEHDEEIDIVRQLLDEMQIDKKENIEELRNEINIWLKKFVEKYIDSVSTDEYKIGNWRLYCIRYPELIGAVNKKYGILGYLKIDDVRNKISIMKSTKAYGYVWDFYTYALKLRLEEKMNIELEYKDYVGENSEDNYIKYTNNKGKEIRIWYNNSKYWIDTLNEKEPNQYNTEAKAIENFEKLISDK